MPTQINTPYGRKFKGFWPGVFFAFAVSIASGVAHGWLDGRWVKSADLRPVVDGLKDLPEIVGQWKLLKEETLPDATVLMLRCYGYSHRIYVNSQSGTQVTVAVLFGPRGPIAVHVPEICYSGVGVTAKGERRRVEFEAGGLHHDVWQLELMSKVDGTPALEVHYAWSDGNRWQASEHPRFWAVNRLFKIQIAAAPTTAGKESESIQFLKDFFPAIQELISKGK